MLFSIAVHAAVLFVIPGWAPWPVRHLDDYVEVELTAGVEPEPVAQGPLITGEEVGGPAVEPPVATDSVSSQPPGQERASLAGPSVILPDSTSTRLSRQVFDSVPLPALRAEQPPAQRLPEGPSRSSFGSSLGSFAVKGPSKLPPPVSAPMTEQTLPQPAPQQPRGGRPAPSTHSIRGPAAQRTVLYQPPPPPVKIEVETEIQLKFWIQPDGRVGRVIPLIKGDAKLEEQMIAYLKGWIFDRQIDTSSAQEVWGILTIRFRLT